MPLDRRQLKSSAISLCEYDDETQDLSVTFTNGRTYDLTGVPPDLFEGLCSAPSAGQFFNTYLRGRY
jgi:lysyl-tRNA synthetase class 2